MKERIRKIYRWKSEFASNGWLDWFCPDCGKKVWNDDVHVSLDWNYCPLCGSKMYEEVKFGDMEYGE